MANMRPTVILFIIMSWMVGALYGAPYYGKFIGKLSELHHGVSGEVYAVDGRTLYLKDFTYDGQGPAAYFYASTGRNANSAGFRLRDENGSPEVIRRYRKEGVTLTLPEGKTLNNIKIFYVWCEEFEVNFGDVKIPRNFDYPRPQKIDALKGVHAISSDPLVIVDAQTLLVPNLSYDGEAPDAKFWVGRGSKPSPQGIRVSDENGKSVPLRRYDRKTVVLTLPGDLTVFDIGHFGIWCEAFTVDFGHIQIPQNINVPPSLKMLGVSPQSKLNCEVLYDDLAFEVRWAVAGDSIVLQLVAKLDEREYMSFGISGDDSRSEMIGGDVVVAWVDRDTLKGYAEDYHLAAKSQCSGPSGSCPDNRLSENTNNVRLLNAAMVNGYSIVTYQRPLKPSDEFDRQIHTNRSQAIIWAIGPLNQRNEVSFHSHYTKGDQFLNFGRLAQWNCPMPEGEQPVMKTTSIPPPTTPKPRGTERRRGGGSNRKEVSDNENSATRNRQTEKRGSTRRGASNKNRTVPTPAPVTKRDAWDIPPIKCDEPEDGVFYAQMGPTGGKRGYPAITGHVGWGISWYINGLLIPEINVVRGKTYTFVVEGGFDPEVAAKYHPFYITDDPVGGYEYKTQEEKKNIRIFAGAVVAKDGSVKPTGTGRLCHWTQQGDLDADDFESFGAYQRSLELKCDQGEPGVIQWTPDEDTPDTVYYQCFTHRYLGWKINVHDTCDDQAEASEIQVSIVSAPDLQESPSIRIESRVKPNVLIVEDKEDKNNTTVSELKVISPVTTQPTLVPKTISSSIYVPIFTPYIYENSFSQPSFKPNFPLDTVRMDFKTKNVSAEAPESTLPLSTVTTTDATIISTTKTIISTDKLREKFIIAAPSITPKNQSLFPPLVLKNNFVMRRPIIKRRPYHPPMVRLPHKKPVYRPVKRPIMEPLYFSDPMKLSRPSNFLIPRPLIKVYPTAQAVTIQNVEISPFQQSTEKIPDQQMMQSALQKESFPQSYINSAPSNFTSFKMNYIQSIKPAKNTGFRPESVVIEGGFKPIVTKEFQKRILEEPESTYESLIGVINQKRHPHSRENFEPMFVPSPIDKIKQKKFIIKKVIIKHPRSVPEDDIVASAAERVESYYLPPLGSQPQISESQQSSNIDIESPENIDLASPPDIVVTYDGKRVSGASLTAKIADRSSILHQRASKAAELIKARPQFAPFKGELPPLNPEIINKQVPQLQSRGLIRDPETPPLTSTKLRLIRQKRSEKKSSLI